MKKKIKGPLRVGLIGCGNICNQYFKGVKPFPDLVRITACADIDIERALAKAAEHGIEKACSVKELLADPDVDIILNLTIPKSHAEVNLAALRAGKHVYCEKPFSLNRKEGVKVVAEAQKRKLLIGCAPDTVLGGGIQTVRKLIDDGAIGKPVAALAKMMCHGHESWHPNPGFFYQAGGGPLFDMGPYYLTSLLTMLGPVRSVSAEAQKTFRERLVTSRPFNGKKIRVEIPTHLSGTVQFVNGALATVLMSFDVWSNNLPCMEIYGTEGSISCPDPNHFKGEVKVWTIKEREWKTVPLTHSGETGRGFGLADMAHAILHRRPMRMAGEMGLHVVDVMEAFHDSARTGKRITLRTTCNQPAALKAGLPLGRVE